MLWQGIYYFISLLYQCFNSIICVSFLRYIYVFVRAVRKCEYSFGINFANPFGCRKIFQKGRFSNTDANALTGLIGLFFFFSFFEIRMKFLPRVYDVKKYSDHELAFPFLVFRCGMKIEYPSVSTTYILIIGAFSH